MGRLHKNWWMKDPGYLKYTALLRNTSILVDEIAPEMVEWLRRPTQSYEAYAAVIRDVCRADKNGCKADIAGWTRIMPRLEELLEYFNQHGSFFGKTIINECMGHRYADYLLQTGDMKYEEKMRICYEMSWSKACRGKYIKNIDSSLYWLAWAYDRACAVDDLSEYREYLRSQAIKNYCNVANRKGKRFIGGSEPRKVKRSKVCCNRNKMMSEKE